MGTGFNYAVQYFCRCNKSQKGSQHRAQLVIRSLRCMVAEVLDAVYDWDKLGPRLVRASNDTKWHPRLYNFKNWLITNWQHGRIDSTMIVPDASNLRHLKCLNSGLSNWRNAVFASRYQTTICAPLWIEAICKKDKFAFKVSLKNQETWFHGRSCTF